MKIQKNKMLGGGGVDRTLSTSNNNNKVTNFLSCEKDVSNCQHLKKSDTLQHDLNFNEKYFLKKNNRNKTFYFNLEKQRIEQNKLPNYRGFEDIKTKHNILKYAIILFLWLFVFTASAIMLFFTNIINGNQMFNLHNNFIAEGSNDVFSNGIGDGSVNSPFQISTYADLITLANKVNTNVSDIVDYRTAYYELINNISDDDGTSSTTWTPIGLYKDADGNEDTNICFKGNFNGNGHIIKFTNKVTIANGSSESKCFAGLFGYVNSGNITNLKVNWQGGLEAQTSTWVNGYAGGIVAYNLGTISDCSNVYESEIISVCGYSFLYTGGIAGCNSGIITDCYNSGTVTGTSENDAVVGGIVGEHSSWTTIIKNSYNEGVITAKSTGSSTSSKYIAYVGGIAGKTDNDFDACYNLGNISLVAGENGYAGGIVGFTSSSVIIKGCYNKGKVAAGLEMKSGHIGGIVGHSEGEITDCYNLGNIETNTGNTGGGIVGYTVNSIEYCYNKGEISLSRGSAGGIAGYIDGATLSFCYNMGNFDADNRNNSLTTSVGGIVASANNATINYCYNDRNIDVISNYAYVGGIAARIQQTTISNCYNSKTLTVKMSDTQIRLGGIVGYVNDSSSDNASVIANCYNKGDIKSQSPDKNSCITYIGGIVGFFAGETVISCYNVGLVSGSVPKTLYQGGIVGSVSGSSKIEFCYHSSNINTAGSGASAVSNCSNTNVTSKMFKSEKNYSKSTTELQYGWGTDWDFTNCWAIDETEAINNGYPYLVKVKFSVTYQSYTGGPHAVKFYERGEVTVISNEFDFTNEDKSIVGWQLVGSETFYELDQKFLLTDNIELLAVWGYPKYEIKFNINTNVGAILFISDGVDVERQVFVNKVSEYNDEQPTFTLLLTPNKEYTIYVSTFYTASINFADGEGQVSFVQPDGQTLVGNVLMFTPSENLIVRLNINAFVGNNGIVI